ncbi:MAG: MaoC/PaaZ C-terminal domain-containing protein [Candidatus Binatia bacterium]
MERKRLTFANVKEGDEIPTFVVENITRTDIVKYAGASGDFNPIHHDEAFAKSAGYPSVFAHGMLSAGFLSKCVTDYVGRPNLRLYRVSFRTQVWPGDTLTCGGKVTRRFEEQGERRIAGEVTAINQKGEVAVQGSFVAAVPAG